eukprot:3200606-Amphidinium_carterae.2
MARSSLCCMSPSLAMEQRAKRNAFNARVATTDRGDSLRSFPRTEVAPCQFSLPLYPWRIDNKTKHCN